MVRVRGDCKRAVVIYSCRLWILAFGVFYTLPIGGHRIGTKAGDPILQQELVIGTGGILPRKQFPVSVD